MIIMNQKHKSGFTLIEILIVIAIIGMIVGLLLPNFNQLRQEGRDQARKTGVKALVEALEMYKLNQNPPEYPAAIPNLNTGDAWEDGSITYLNQTPVDPLYDADEEQFNYRYGLNGVDTQRYYVGVCLEDASDPDGRPSPDQTIFDDDYCDSNLWYYKTEP